MTDAQDDPLWPHHNILLAVMETPEHKRDYEAYKARVELALRVFGWMRRVPFVGSLMWTFWSDLFIERSIRNTMKPRWGTLTFAFLNDGQGATLWHTWRQMTHDSEDPYTGIYVSGAPRSLTEAKSLERLWAITRE